MRRGREVTRPIAYDFSLLFPVLLLVGIGVVMIYSASSALALKKFGNEYYFLKKQAFFALIGCLALLICRYFPYRIFRSLTYPMVGLALGMLLAARGENDRAGFHLRRAESIAAAPPEAPSGPSDR